VTPKTVPVVKIIRDLAEPGKRNKDVVSPVMSKRPQAEPGKAGREANGIENLASGCRSV
jgi:hypothetical protein